MHRFLVIWLLTIPWAFPHAVSAQPATGFTVVRSSQGIRLTIHFARRNEPRHALTPVTITILNLRHQHLAIERARHPYGLCSGPSVRLTPVDARGHVIQQPHPIPVPMVSCPFPGTVLLPVGHRVVQRQLVELASSRLRVDASVSNYVHNCYCGFSLRVPDVHVALHPAPAPQIAIRPVHGRISAVVAPPPGASGRMYYVSWGDCRRNLGTVYWTPAESNVVSSGCARHTRWHIAVGWLNSPVQTLDLGG